VKTKDIQISKQSLTSIKESRYQQHQRDTSTEEYKTHLAAVALSIATDGLKQVPQARYNAAGSGGHYELAFGNTRFAAFKLLDSLTERKRKVKEIEGIPISDELWYATRKREAEFEAMPLVVAEMSEQEFFEAGMIENLQRKALDTLEEAQAYQFYMQHFDANSNAAGLKFGKNPSTIRGMVRLLNLPQPVREALRDGYLAQETARKLLRLQDIVPGMNTITKTVLEKARDGVITQPEVDRLIIGGLQNCKHVQLLWGDYTTGTTGNPKAGKGLWELNWQQKVVRRWTANKVMKLLTEIGAAQEILREIIKAAQDESANNKWAQDILIDIIEEVRDHNATDNELEESFGIGQVSSRTIRAMIRPMPCDQCPLHVKFDNLHFCGASVCHSAKIDEFKAYELQRVAEKLGLPVYDSKKVAKPRAFEVATKHVGPKWMGKTEETEYVQWFEDKAKHLYIMATSKAADPYDFTNSHFVQLISIRDELQPEYLIAQAEAAGEIVQDVEVVGGQVTVITEQTKEAEALEDEHAQRMRAEREANEMRQHTHEQATALVFTEVAPWLAAQFPEGTSHFWISLLEYQTDDWNVREIMTPDEDPGEMTPAELEQWQRDTAQTYVLMHMLIGDMQQKYDNYVSNMAEVYERLDELINQYLGDTGVVIPDWAEVWEANENSEAEEAEASE